MIVNMGKNVKVSVLICFVFVFLCLSVSSVYAQETGKEAGENVRDMIQNFGKIIFGNVDASNPMTLMTYFFLGLVLFLLIYSVLEKTPLFGREKKFLNLVVSFAVVILIFTSLSKDFLSAMLLPYGTLGILLLIILPPFIVLFFSIKIKSLTMSRILWIFFSAYYFIFFFYYYPSDNKINLIYLIDGIIGAFMILFVGVLRKHLSDDKVGGFLEKMHLLSSVEGE